MENFGQWAFKLSQGFNVIFMAMVEASAIDFRGLVKKSSRGREWICGHTYDS